MKDKKICVSINTFGTIDNVSNMLESLVDRLKSTDEYEIKETNTTPSGTIHIQIFELS